MAGETAVETPVSNLKTIREASISPRDVDVLKLSDGKGQEFGEFVRFTVALPGYHPSISNLSFMVASHDAEKLARQYQSGSGKIKVYTYSGNDATRHVARVFTGETDMKGVFALPCPEPVQG
ncbi:MAG TPA: hypothetical protein VJ242_03080 [Patescibacteria group bacterium]|nr:MAG: hypothetical protein A3J17_05390 [Candidatus Curtissbacteria bacterium RIFCSPLOWO2_02_FULL_40_11]HKZ35676.1 hypothetical protein [Patescibacteria group bacterium]